MLPKLSTPGLIPGNGAVTAAFVAAIMPFGEALESASHFLCLQKPAPFLEYGLLNKFFDFSKEQVALISKAVTQLQEKTVDTFAQCTGLSFY